MAFSLVEALVGTMVIGVLFITMYSGISMSFGVIMSARENLRATQIMLDRTEEFRIYKYSFVTNPGSYPSTWSEPYFPTNQNYGVSDLNTATNLNNNTGGFLYYGTLTVSQNTTFTDTAYMGDLMMIKVELRWTNTAPRYRTMSTIYSHYGMQGYLYN